MYPKDCQDELTEDLILTGSLEPTNEGYAIAKIMASKLCEYAQSEFGLSYKTLILVIYMAGMTTSILLNLI